VSLVNAPNEEKVKERPNLSILAMMSFILSFMVARTFTILSPTTTWTSGGYHIHHFWYGIAMLAIGGWLGISYQNDRIDRLAAILFGAGGGIIGDEAGLLLTLQDYWTGMTYTLIIIFLTLVSMLVLLFRYSRVMAAEFAELTRSRESIYVGIFLAVVSIAVILETESMIIIAVSGVLTAVSCLMILGYFIQRFRKKR
jgi:hypothetical protein